MDEYEDIVRRLVRKTGFAFRPATADSIEHLRNWKLPDAVIRFYSRHEPQDVIEEGIRVWPVANMVTENEQGVPGICVMPYGYVVFASTYCGDAFCFDLNRLNEHQPTIVLVSHEAVGEDSSADEVHSMVKPVATSLPDFLERWCRDEVDEECIYPPFP